MIKKKGFLRDKNIENAQKELYNTDYFTPRSRNSEYDEDEDEEGNEKTKRDIYQGNIEDMKGLKLPREIESKDEESQMYLKSNLDKLKIIFLVIMINIYIFSILHVLT